MSYIYQTAASAANAYTATISMWVRVPDGWTGTNLMRWGTDLNSRSQSVFYIYLGDGTIGAGFVGYGDYQSYDTGVFLVTPFVGGDCEAAVSGRVFHVMLAFDTSGDSFTQEYGAHGSGMFRTHHLTMKCVINGVVATEVDRRGGSEPDVINTGDVLFTAAWSGYEIGIPVSPSTADLGSQITIGQTQIWVGQFIDPTVSANYEKFVDIRGSNGYQVDASVAADAFGAPTYCFYGDNSSFPINRGSGGPFLSNGIINNKPGLSY